MLRHTAWSKKRSIDCLHTELLVTYHALIIQLLRIDLLRYILPMSWIVVLVLVIWSYVTVHWGVKHSRASLIAKRSSIIDLWMLLSLLIAALIFIIISHIHIFVEILLCAIVITVHVNTRVQTLIAVGIVIKCSPILIISEGSCAYNSTIHATVQDVAFPLSHYHLLIWRFDAVLASR